MKDNDELLDPLLEKVEKYGLIKLELIRLKALDKFTSLFSEIACQSLLFGMGFLFLATFSAAVALYLGELLGKNYWGFLCVSGFYVLCLLLVYTLMPALKLRVKNSLIKLFMNASNED